MRRSRKAEEGKDEDEKKIFEKRRPRANDGQRYPLCPAVHILGN